MCFFSKKRMQKIELLDSECNALCEELEIAIGAANLYFANPDMYIDVSFADSWTRAVNHGISPLSSGR